MYINSEFTQKKYNKKSEITSNLDVRFFLSPYCNEASYSLGFDYSDNFFLSFFRFKNEILIFYPHSAQVSLNNESQIKLKIYYWLIFRRSNKIWAALTVHHIRWIFVQINMIQISSLLSNKIFFICRKTDDLVKNDISGWLKIIHKFIFSSIFFFKRYFFTVQ